MSRKLINRLTDFIQFEKEVRAAESINAFGFTVCNYLNRLVAYDVAVLLVEKSGSLRVNSISGVSDFDHQSPLVLACESLCNHSNVLLSDIRVHDSHQLPADVGQRLNEIHLPQLISVSLDSSAEVSSAEKNSQGTSKSCPGGVLVLTRTTAWEPQEIKLLDQARDVLCHALAALKPVRKGRLSNAFKPTLKPDWRWAVCGLALLSVIPVPQSIIADAEVTARTPAVVAAGLNGVVEEVLVRPNEKVEAGQLLVRFDSTDLTHRKNTLLQELSLAKERLRKARQHSLGADTERARFTELASQIELKQLELDYVEDSIGRLELRADKEGVALFSRQQDWMGRAVATGEKIMEIADVADSQFEIWVAANDAIEISAGRKIKFFPDAKPLQSVAGSIDSVGFTATPYDGDQLGYRVLADPSDSDATLRLGMKGTARLYGETVLLGYHVLRKPISAFRRTVGV